MNEQKKLIIVDCLRCGKRGRRDYAGENEIREGVDPELQLMETMVDPSHELYPEVLALPVLPFYPDLTATLCDDCFLQVQRFIEAG